MQSGIKHLCASRAQNDALEATPSHSAQAQFKGEVQSTKERDINGHNELHFIEHSNTIRP